MSSNELEDLPLDDSKQPEGSPETFLVPSQQPLIETQNTSIEAKTFDSLDDDDEHMNTRRNRELKQLLALSKEAKLDTNISYKRKSIETFKMKEYAAAKPPEGSMVIKKYKPDKFPVTADSELDLEIPMEIPVPEKIKSDEVKTKEVTGGEERKSMKDCKPFKPNKDIFCWRCHREGVTICCETCPRSYHQKCLKQTITDIEHWPCPECVSILKAENTQSRSKAMKGMTLEHLCSLLKFAVKRMIECNGSEPFLHEVNDKEFPDYKKYIIQPMTLTSLDKNIKENLYGSTQAFEADAKWILHNSIIFNSYQSKLTSSAKTILKICKQEMAEIENCSSCYLNANTKKNTWFVEVCPKPHILVWAKLKGFPYWPAKAMCTNTTGMVDVRFFGAHDRAWVPSRECFLYSRKDPNSNKQKRNDIIECMREVEVYISNLKALYGEFNYAPFKLPYDPDNELKQLSLFIPRYKPNGPPPRRKSRPPESRARSVKRDEVNESDDNIQPQSKEHEDEKIENDSIITNESFLLSDKDLDISTIKDVEVKDSESPNEDETLADLNDDNEPLSRLAGNKLPRGSIRTRGGLNNSPGKLKVIPRKVSEEFVQKDVTMEEISSNEITETNSEQSIKDDIPNSSNTSQSDNLESANASDNAIGSSTNDSESKKQDAENSDNSISPPSKIKITDKLMKKLSKSEEDLLKSKEDQTQIKSQTDILLEQYKNLVQEKNETYSEIETSIALESTSIPPTNVCELTSDEKLKDEQMETDTVKLETKNDGKNNEIASDGVVIPSTENLKPAPVLDGKKTENEITCGSELKKTNSEIKRTETIAAVLSKGDVPDVKQPESDAPVVKKVTNQENITLNTEILKESKKEVKSGSEDIINKEERKLATKSEPKTETPRETRKENRKRERIVVKITPKRVDKRDSKKLEIVQDKVQETKKIEVVTKNTTQTKRIELRPKVVDTKVTNNKPEDVKKVTSTQIKVQKLNENDDVKTQNKTKPSNTSKEETQIVEQLDSNSSDDVNIPLDASQIDESNIINIIHSSLNNIEKTPKRRIEETTIQRNENGDVEDLKNGNLSKKQKLDESNHDVEDTGFKIIPIQAILNKKIDCPEQAEAPETPILRKKLSQSKTSNETTNNTVEKDMETVEIKSEPESCDDEMEETEYMEKKRKYLSALNISERGLIMKRDEVKTRSKMDESGRTVRYLDNLSKVIDEVATTYSAKHEASKKTTDKKTQGQSSSNHQMNVRKLAALQENGEIYVKSFAKLPQQQQQVRAPSQKPLHKPKPSNTFTLKVPPPTRREQPQKNNNEIVPTTTLQRVPTSCTLTSNPQSVPVSTASKAMESIASSGNVLILTQPGVILPTSQQLALNTGGFVTFVPSQQNMTMMQTPQVINAVMTTGLQQTENVQQPLQPSAEIHNSQNYIPQSENEPRLMEPNTAQVRTPTLVEPSRPNVHPDIPSLIPINNTSSPTRNNNTTASAGLTDASRTEATDDEFSILNSLVPENVSRAISEVLCRPPPKLKPRPPGPLSQTFDTGNPSSAGPVSARINSVAHRLSDYMRGMLIETLEDLGKSNNTEATIVSLKLELETLQNKHAVEMMDLRKNMCTILKDIQTSITEEKERLINETRSACEVEALRRIEEAKSKQWCACCGKEAQFYCCWNTSYCDYPCQQKHWSKHMNKCTQHTGQSQPSQNSLRPQSQITFRPATPKTFAGRVVAKPTKVYLNRASNSKTVPTFKATAGSHVALLDTSNLEFLTSTSLPTKFIATSSFLTKVKTVNSTVTSPSNSIQQTVLNKKINNSIQTQPSSSNSNNKNMSNVISDEEAESE